jgi:hypothetical protein
MFETRALIGQTVKRGGNQRECGDGPGGDLQENIQHCLRHSGMRALSVKNVLHNMKMKSFLLIKNCERSKTLHTQKHVQS